METASKSITAMASAGSRGKDPEMWWVQRRNVLFGLAVALAWPAAADEKGKRGRYWGALAFPSSDGRGVPAPRRTVEVEDGNGLAAALGRARAGDHIVLADGEYAYGKGFELASGGEPGTPVVVRSARPGGAVLHDPVLIVANDACLMALDFAVPDAVTIHGDRTAILRCRFGNLTGILLRRGASYNRIGWNSFRDLPSHGSEGKNAIRLDPRPRDPRPMTSNHIYRNYFSTDFDDERNEGICIYVGVSKDLTERMPPTATLIEYNLLDRIDYKSAVRIKAHGCMVRFNTALGPGRRSGHHNRGQFAQRQGEGNRWHGNWAEATTGFRLNGRGQELLGNVAAGGASIDLNCGSARNKTACSYSLFVANEGPCRVGNREFDEPVTELCQSNWFEAHKPDAEAIGLSRWQAQTSIAPRTTRRDLPWAIRLEPSDVGADAPGAPRLP
jgi:hypothetical protein